MAHKNTKSGQKDTQIMSFEKESKSRDHLRLSVTPSDKLPESPAERYILSRSQMLNNSQDISPETPSPIASTTLKSLRSPMNHSEWMQNWHQQQTNNLYKKRKHGYVYGPPPASSSSSSSVMLLSSPMYSTSSNRSMTSQSPFTMNKSRK